MSNRKTHPTITADQILVGDVVRLNGRIVPSMPHLIGRFRIIKAKPIMGNRVQIKCHDLWTNSTVRKFDLKIGPVIDLIERDGQDMGVAE